MRKLWLLAQTDIRLEFAHRSSWLPFFILPAIFMVVLSFAFDVGGEEVQYPLLFVDEAPSVYTAFVREQLERVGMEVIPVSRAEADRLFEKGRSPMVLVLPAEISDRLRRGEPVEVGILEDGRDNRVVAMRQAVRAALRVVVESADVAREGTRLAREFGVSVEERTLVEAVREGLAHPPLDVETVVVGTARPQMLNASQQSAAGQLVTWGLITFLTASSLLLHEREAGTLGRLLSTPVSRTTVLMGKLLARYLLGLVQIAILVVFGWVVLGVDWGRSPTALIAVVLAFGLMGVSLGVLLATVVRNAQAASALSTFLSMVLAALGGAWWPLEITPPLYRQVAQIFPTTWAMRAFESIFLRGATFRDVLMDVGVLVAYALVFAFVGLWRFYRT